MYTFVLVIQIRTSRYLECTITLEVNDRTYMQIGTVCKGFRRVFTQWLRFICPLATYDRFNVHLFTDYIQQVLIMSIYHHTTAT